MKEDSQLLTIVGPTAVGKSELGVELARACDGEVISADSRQVYRGLDIGTGKITEDQMRGVPHHCLDIADPHKQLTVAEYKACADNAIVDIQKRDKLPIVVGGTGFYVQAVVDDIDFPEVPPDHELREELDQKSAEELFAQLQEKDPKRAETIERDNKRRLIRALEIVAHRGKVPDINSGEPPYDLCMIGLYRERDELKQRIRTRTEKRLASGLIEEVEQLRKNGLSLELLKEIGLTYYHLARYLEGAVSQEELTENIVTAEYQYARKQLSWFRRDERTAWFRADRSTAAANHVAAWLHDS